jgi:methionyl-tRNA formyltransferase
MKTFLFLGSRRGWAVLKKLVEAKVNICGVLCLIDDPHEEPLHLKITELTKTQHIPIYFSNQVKPSEYAEILKRHQPDFAFAIGWRFMINKAAYNVPTKGTLVVHDSLLPKYRGFAPTNWVLINGETETGVTLFYIADEVDSGPIVDQLKTSISLEDTATTLDEKIIRLYEEIIVKNLKRLEDPQFKPSPQNETEATYTCKRIPEDGKIDWSKSTMQIYNLIRATTHPFPGAFAYFKGKKILVWQAKLPATQKQYVGSIPGRVVGKHNGMIEVLTGDGSILLGSLQFENEPELAAQDFVVSVKDTFH